jgi:penicillin-binding protein-related factor A (putative recombinase)
MYISYKKEAKGITSLCSHLLCYSNPTKVYYKDIEDLENVQKNEKRRRANLKDVELIQIRCQNLSMSKTNLL